MKKFVTKIGVGITTAGLLVSLMVPVIYADNTISGNGESSVNSITTTTVSNCTVSQDSSTHVDTNATVSSSTGKNDASSNTGGGVSIDTGAASSTLTLTVTGGSNKATNPCCPCKDQSVKADNSITDNGEKTSNTVVTVSSTTTSVTQKSKTKVKTTAKVKSKTGQNTADGNTGGGTVSITTGGGTSSMSQTVTGGNNTL